MIAAAGGTLVVPATVSQAAPALQAAGESVLDKLLRTKQANLGVDLTFPPLSYHDPNTNKPAGYLVELVELMIKLKAFVTNWLRYQGTHNVLSGLWNKWAGNDCGRSTSCQ
jgi:ABC-type amino acid transport substrate-binding protein